MISSVQMLLIKLLFRIIPDIPHILHQGEAGWTCLPHLVKILGLITEDLVHGRNGMIPGIYLEYTWNVPSHQILVEMDGNGVNPHKSPIVDGLCLCVSCRLGSQCFTTFHPHFDCLIKQLLVIPATSNFELGAMSPCATQGVQ